MMMRKKGRRAQGICHRTEAGNLGALKASQSENMYRRARARGTEHQDVLPPTLVSGA